MKSNLLNMMGTAVLAIGIILHIACLATPYYFSADFSKLKDDMKGLNLSKLEKEMIYGMAKYGGKIDSGLWKVCHHDFNGTDCADWDKAFKVADWVKGAQAMSVLGVLVMGFGAILAFINVVVKSQGDRLLLFPYIICGLCCLGGIFTLIGDIIVAAEYRSVLMPQEKYILSPTVKALLVSEFHLSWGFDLDIVAFVLAILAGIIHVLAGRRSESSGLV